MSNQDASLISHDDVDDVEGKVFIGGLSWQTTEGTLRAHFEKFGELTDVALMIDKRTGQPRGFGFIKLKYPAAADIVVAQEHVIDGRKVDVKKAVPRDRAPAPTRTESKKIFVGGLSAEVNDKIFYDYFSKFGVVKDAVVMVDRSTNRSRGFGFVTFESEDAVDNVCKTENTILGKWVEVKRAEPRDLKFDSGANNGRGGGPSGGAFRGRGMDMRNPRMGYGGRGDEYGGGGAGYGMSPYGRGYGGGGYPGYGNPSPYPMQGYGAGGYGAYPPQGAYGGYGGQMPTGYGNAPQGYGGRGSGHESVVDPSTQSNSTHSNYGVNSNTPQNSSPSGSYDNYARGQQQQQYSNYHSQAVGNYGNYGMYNNASNNRNMSAQDSYEGAYGGYRQQGNAQARVERSYKPY